MSQVESCRMEIHRLWLQTLVRLMRRDHQHRWQQQRPRRLLILHLNPGPRSERLEKVFLHPAEESPQMRRELWSMPEKNRYAWLI